MEISSPSSATRVRRESSSTRTSATLLSSSVWLTNRLHSLGLDDSGHRHHLVPADDERPRLALGSRNLRVDEHVLDLLAATRQVIAGSPPAYLKPLLLGRDPPPAPADLAVEVDRRPFQPCPVVLADDLAPAPEIESLRAVDRLEQADELGRRRLAVRQAQEIALGGRVKPAEQRQDLVPDQAALRIRIGRVAAEVEGLGEAVGLRLIAPALEERTDDPVGAAPVDLPGRAARDDAVEDGLDLVGRGVAGRAQPVGGDGVADLAPVVLGLAASPVDDLRAENVTAEGGVVLGLLAAQAVVHVQRGNVIAELTERVPEARRVGTAGDEDGHGAAGRNQLALADVRFDGLPKVSRVHPNSLA